MGYFKIFCTISVYLFIKNCFAQEQCPETNQFLCSNGDCISKEHLCDGSRECSDGSDETHDLCLFRSCSESLDYMNRNQHDIFAIASFGQGQSFRCDYGACINSIFICDGIKHCVVDGSDETEGLCSNHVCNDRQFKCAYGACISERYVCDNRYQCHDGSDETPEACELRNRFCSSRMFKCSYGACIHKRKQCNAVIDCLDHSDESEEICGLRPNIVLRSSIPVIPNEVLKKSEKPQTTTSSTQKPVQPGINLNPKEGRHGCKLTDDFVAVEIIRCGDESYCDEETLPIGTNIIITCSDTSSPLKCKEDFLWHFVRDPSRHPREIPCRDTNSPNSSSSSSSSSSLSLNPPVQPIPNDCGHLPMLSPIPWLVGLFLGGKFSCTGTIIGPSLILTAGHCIAGNQASNRRTISPSEVKVQVNSPNPNDPNQFASVSLMILHPKYVGGTTPQNDIALLFLNENLETKYGLSSACIDKDGKILNVPAYTFNRTVGETFYRWRLFPQNLDTTCVNRASRCSRHLNISENQFCGTNRDSPLYLHQGSSGGPYMIAIKNTGVEKWTIAGIVSSSIYTTDCGTPHMLFTSVNKFHQWIINCGFLGDCRV